MRLLLDTHALLWWLAGSRELSISARQAIENPANEVLVSAASAFEIATKYRLGKVPGAAAIAADLSGCIGDQGFAELSISLSDGARAGGLAGIHRDPFDRMLIAQAIGHDLVLVSNEALFDHYGVRRLW
jgi:PIN domain nuclease of toxin-antitoxin system